MISMSSAVNLSLLFKGDLKDPAVAIPKGTLLAIGSTYATYIFYGIVTAFVYTTKASGIAEEYSIWTNDSIPDEDKLLVSRGLL